MKYLYYPIIILLLALTIVEFFPTFGWACNHISRYQWMLYGMVGYFVVRMIPLVSRNEQWLQTFSHELSHTIVGLMFFQKIHSFHAEENQGIVWHSGKSFGDIFISLAPYCLPIFTYAFLLLRRIGVNKMLNVFYLFIGFTLAFYLVYFLKQTGLYRQIFSNKDMFYRSYILPLLVFLM